MMNYAFGENEAKTAEELRKILGEDMPIVFVSGDTSNPAKIKTKIYANRPVTLQDYKEAYNIVRNVAQSLNTELIHFNARSASKVSLATKSALGTSRLKLFNRDL